MSTLAPHAAPASMPLKSFLQRPKLVVVIVIDQFRADYLTRMNSRFQKPGTNGQVGGFLYLMNQGAYFPFAEYDVFQSMTCPGHAMILTGSTPDLTGIPINEWFDRKTQKMHYCAEDDQGNISPKNMKTSTVGDELKNAGVPAKVIGIALKDRSAVMLTGHRADLALWYDTKEKQWTTSSYYRAELPAWTQGLNKKLSAEMEKPYVWKTARFEYTTLKGTKQSMIYPYGTEMAFAAAEAALKNEKMGKNAGTDILALSLSNHDYMGHWLGPNSPEIEELTVAEDLALSRFLTEVKKHMGGFQDVVIALTADHGVAPLVEDMQAAKVESGKIDYLALYKNLNERLDKKYGMPSNKQWVVASKSFHFYLDQETLKEKKLSSEEVEEEVRALFLSTPGVMTVFTRTDAIKGRWPVGMIGDQLKKQYIADMSGDIILIPRPFYIEKDENQATHITGFSYDKQVPLLLMGAKIKAGVYTQPAKVIDLAPTLSFILGTVAPATSQGHVLQIF